MTACQKLQMPPACKAVLMALANNANDQGFCWPSIATVCEDTCYKKNAVIDAIAWLESSKIVTTNKTNGRHTTYTVRPSDFSPVEYVSRMAKTRSNQLHKTTSCTVQPVAQSNPNQLHKATDQLLCATAPVAQSNTNRKEPSITVSKEPSTQVREDFDSAFASFWQEYPKKVGKAEAQKAFVKLKPDKAALQVMIDAVCWQRETDGWRKNGGQYVPNPATWLNQRRWEDEIPASAQKVVEVSLEEYVRDFYEGGGAVNEQCQTLLG